MSLLDLEALLAPINPATPAGDNLEYQPEFAALEEAAIGKPERQMGSGTIPGEPPNFTLLFNRSNDLLRRTKDLRVAAHLTRACIDRAGFVGLHQGLALLHRLVENYWPSVHPQLDPDDGNDPTMRVSALSALISPELLTALRNAPLFTTQVAGPLSLRYFGIAAGELPQQTDGPKVDNNLIEAGFRLVLQQNEVSPLCAIIGINQRTIVGAEGDVGSRKPVVKVAYLLPQSLGLTRLAVVNPLSLHGGSHLA